MNAPEKPLFENEKAEVYEHEVRLYQKRGALPRELVVSFPRKFLASLLGSEEYFQYMFPWWEKPQNSQKWISVTADNIKNLSFEFIGFGFKKYVVFPGNTWLENHSSFLYIKENRGKFPNISDDDILCLSKDIETKSSFDYYLKEVFSKSPNWVRTGSCTYEHKVDGIIHNDNGPAKYEFYYEKAGDSRRLRRIEYYKNGIIHRDDGPASYKPQYIIDTEKKTVFSVPDTFESYFYLNGKSITCIDFIQQLIEKEKLIASFGKIPASISETKEVKKMESKEEKTFIGQVKSDARNAGIRIACRKSVSVVQSTLIQLLSHNKSPKEAKSIKKGIDALFLSEYGKGMIGYIMGQALPVIKTRFPERYQPIMEELATEFRIEGMAVAGEEALNSILGIFKLAEGGLMGAMTDLVEPLEKLRVEDGSKPQEIGQSKKEFAIEESSKIEQKKENSK